MPVVSGYSVSDRFDYAGRYKKIGPWAASTFSPLFMLYSDDQFVSDQLKELLDSAQDPEQTEEIKTFLLSAPDKQQILFKNPLMKVYNTRAQRKKDMIKQPYDDTAGLYQCRNLQCLSWNTVHFSQQKRAADEAMTVFVQCFNCNQRYRQ